MPALDTASKLPLYAQIADDLEREMASGRLAIGERLPSEHALAEAYGVGRPTVRQATESLVRSGMLRRRRGAGTFVCEPPLRVDLFSLGGTLRSFSRGGVRLKTSLVERPRRVTLDGESSSPLAGREVFAMCRLGRVGGEPVLLERFELAADVFEDFASVAMRGRPLSEVVAERYRLAPTSADQSFSAVAAEATIASSLEVETGAPLLRVARELHFPGASSAVFALMHCRTDRFEPSHHIGDMHG